MIGWKVMRIDEGAGRLVSGMDSRMDFPAEVGSVITMPGKGVYLTLDREYALRHYAVHDLNALLELEFDPATLKDGNLTDRETEFAVPSAVIRSIELYDWDLEPVGPALPSLG